MSETPHTPAQYETTPPVNDEGVNIAADVYAAEAWAHHTLRSADATEQEIQAAAQRLKEAKVAHANYETRSATGPVPVGQILKRMVDLEERAIYFEPGAERLREMRVAERNLAGIRQARADLIQAIKDGEEIDADALEVNGWELAQAIAWREQLTQQSEADQP